MSKYENLIEKILQAQSDANIHFDDVCHLLLRLGFNERIKGSHHIFRKEGVEERLNLQRDGNNVIPYQIKQVRNILLTYNLTELL